MLGKLLRMKNNTNGGIGAWRRGGIEEEIIVEEEEHFSVASGLSCNEKRREGKRTWLPLIYYGGNVGRGWDDCSLPTNFVLNKSGSFGGFLFILG